MCVLSLLSCLLCEADVELTALSVLSRQVHSDPGGSRFQRVSHFSSEMQGSAHEDRVPSVCGRDVFDAGGDDVVLWRDEAVSTQGCECVVSSRGTEVVYDQSADVWQSALRQMVYLVIKELSTIAEDVIMVTSSIMKDVQPNLEVVYRPNAIRALARIIDVRHKIILNVYMANRC